ncbi:MAG TPA: DUF6510 family protein [Lacisediminihabitans sp.]|uniref:DUF6510 family protein n=1 Tax=Lacisediminihabitans sp. TaxID=2787631 RepID=UPI002ED7FE09
MTGHVDGNVLAGPLSELFRFDPTTASARCASCGDVSVLARAMVYVEDHGLIVRCCTCDDVLMIVVQEPEGSSIDLTGMSWLRVRRP